MPRSSEYLLEGYTYHLTHRCHNRAFLLRFARDRDRYREWLREGVKRYGVSLYGFCITGNHVHLVAHVDVGGAENVSSLMRLAAGSTAKQYNLRKRGWAVCSSIKNIALGQAPQLFLYPLVSASG